MTESMTCVFLRRKSMRRESIIVLVLRTTISHYKAGKILGNKWQRQGTLLINISVTDTMCI